MNDHDYCSVVENINTVNTAETSQASKPEPVDQESIRLNEINLEKIEGALTATESADDKLNSLANLLEDSISQSSIISSQSGRSSSCCDEKTTKEYLMKSEANLITPKKEKKEIEDNIGEYYFETDHLALRGNEDYLALIKTIAILEGQRTKAINDLDRLHKAQEEILANPIEFVERLQRKEDLNLPNAQVIAQLPIIDWDKYLTSFSPHAFNHQHMTRNKPNEMTKSAAEVITNLATETSNQFSRPYKEVRPHSFNQPWTNEEQKRLEELLGKFPSEEVESRRWEKIAQALGNRTRQQVASRVQKYFIKLTKAGIPVPGRAPNIGSYYKKANSHRHQRLNRFLFPPSTFFASFEPPVLMNDDDETMSTLPSSDDDDDENDISDEESFPIELQETSDYKELKMLKRLRKNKALSEGLAIHTGFKCSGCECNPIIGTRWHCLDCPKTDFCNSCVNCSSGDKDHNSSHQVQPIEVNTGFP